ncbi:MAG: UDP-N-acetylmuramoyl-tripeptide--D-alanyl-D-alanine ligase [Solirubrobacteraceae bacterium]
MRLFAAIAATAALLALLARIAGRLHRLLHLLQLEHYDDARLLLWLRRRSELFQMRELLALGALYAAAAASLTVSQCAIAGALLLASTPIAALGLADWRRPAAKPLVFTTRAKRLLATALALSAPPPVAALALIAFHPGTLALGIVLGAGWLLLALAPTVLLLGNALLRPWQNAINRRFVQSARGKLEQTAPLVIGITGSYGKTTSKFCIGKVLEADRRTLVTPESYNSHLGVVRTINELLQPRHEAFVVEMGMFRRGDIAELCELTHPKLGVITAIGPMHLERLGSIEAIEAAKAELMEALPPDGRLFVNGDDPRCLTIAARSHVPVTRFGIDGEQLHVRASRLELARGRTELELEFAAGQPRSVHVSARLLGAHNVRNLLAAAAVGDELGIERVRIAAALSRVRAPQHRLASIENHDAGIVVIDDAYNSNPEGAAAALGVLREHEAQRRVLITPGMVELGELESELNERFGQQAAGVCDLVILIGRTRSEPIRTGLLAGGMDGERIHVVADLSEAAALLGTLRRPGDVILFENDLPDTYAEDHG